MSIVFKSWSFFLAGLETVIKPLLRKVMRNLSWVVGISNCYVVSNKMQHKGIVCTKDDYIAFE